MLLASCGTPQPEQTPTPNENMETTTALSNKQMAADLIRSIETGDHVPIAYINPEKYIQHNLMAADGLAGFGELMKMLPPGGAKAKVVRAFQDGDYALVHAQYDFFGPKAGFDIFRFEDGRIVEHWDNLQEIAAPNPSGHTQFDGPTEATDVEKTETNKTLVRDFLQNILVEGKMEKLAGYFDGDNYTQHNTMIGDGLSGLGSALQALTKQGITMKYDKIHMVLGEGNFVLAASEGTFGGKPTVFYDLFRVQSGKIAEHWDTIETVPPQSEWKNQNGKF
ncbi:MAG: nuclear transport factor 2 family protein [Flavobacteriales bacterium]